MGSEAVCVGEVMVKEGCVGVGVVGDGLAAVACSRRWRERRREEAMGRQWAEEKKRKKEKERKREKGSGPGW